MTREEELLSFIEAAKQKGASDEFLFSLLRAQGWSAGTLYDAFGRHYAALTGTGVPVRQGIVEGARDAFLHLLSFGTLATWTFALGALLFSFINDRFPDLVSNDRYYDVAYGAASNIAALLVGFPVYLYVTRFIVGDLGRYPEKRDSPVRKWLTWLALLIAASVILGDVITFLNYFLRGEISVRFVLKIAVVLAIAGGVFSYYMRSMRGATALHPRYALAAVGSVLLGLVAGFTMLGSPARQRTMQADARRVSDLQTIHRTLYARSPAALPSSLSELNVRQSDPITGQPYQYDRIDDHRYRLCAMFTNDSDRQAADPVWQHPRGRYCYEFDHRRLPQ